MQGKNASAGEKKESLSMRKGREAFQSWRGFWSIFLVGLASSGN